MTDRYAVRLKTVTLYVAEEIDRGTVLDAEAAVPILRAVYADLDADQEHLIILALNAKGRVVGFKPLFSGGMAHSVVDPRIVFRAALLMGADRIIVSHNHPSGDPEPSPDDRATTQRLRNAGREIGIDVVDHIVVGSGTDRWMSFNRRGILS